MADNTKKITVELNAIVGDAAKDVDKFKKLLKDVQDIKINDNCSEVIKKIGEAAKESAQAVFQLSTKLAGLKNVVEQPLKTDDFEKVGKAAKKTAESVKGAAEKTNHATKAMTGMRSAMSEAEMSAQRAGGALGKLAAKTLGVNGSTRLALGAIKNIITAGGGLIGVLVAVGAAVAVVGAKIMSLGSQAEQAVSRISAMKNYLGDASEAYQIFSDTARETGFSPGVIQEMGIQLLNMGYSAQNASELIKLCGDAAVGLGKGQAQAQSFVDTIAKIQSTGSISSQQLQALESQGFKLDEAFKTIGMSGEEAMKAVDDGTMDAQTAVRALTDYMETFGGSMEKSANNVSSMWDKVGRNIDAAMESIGKSIFDAFNQSEIVQDLISFTQDLVNFVRSEGVGGFEVLKAVAEVALDVIAAGLKLVYQTIKIVIMGVAQLYNAFKSIGAKIANALNPILQPLSKIWNYIKSLLSSLGQAFNEYVDTDFGKMYGGGGNDNSFGFDPTEVKGKNKISKRSASGGGSSKAISEEQKAIEALIKKYSDADKMLKNVIKSEIEMARVNLTMLPQSARAEEEVQVKLMSIKAAHDEVMDGYMKELEIADKISDPTTRDNVIKGIEKQIAAEQKLAEAKMKQAAFEGNLKKSREETRNLLDQVFGTDDEYERKIKNIKDGVTRILEIADYAKSSGNAGDYSKEDQGLIAKLLNMTPDALTAELEAKNESLDAFVERNKERIAEGAKALTESEQNAQTWASNTVRYATMVGDAMSNAMMDFITGAKSGKEALSDFVSSMLKNAAQLLTRWLSLFAIFSIVGDPALAARNASAAVFGTNGGSVQLHKSSGFKTITGGGGFFAAGGSVIGAGTSTSDSIPAMLSNGEYVLKAAAVRRIGVPTLNALNTGRYHFADGGYVGGKKLEPSASIGNVTLQVQALDASDFDSFLNLRGGAEQIQNMLYEAERRFSFSMG